MELKELKCYQYAFIERHIILAVIKVIEENNYFGIENLQNRLKNNVTPDRLYKSLKYDGIKDFINAKFDLSWLDRIIIYNTNYQNIVSDIANGINYRKLYLLVDWFYNEATGYFYCNHRHIEELNTILKNNEATIYYINNNNKFFKALDIAQIENKDKRIYISPTELNETYHLYKEIKDNAFYGITDLNEDDFNIYFLIQLLNKINIRDFINYEYLKDGEHRYFCDFDEDNLKIILKLFLDSDFDKKIDVTEDNLNKLDAVFSNEVTMFEFLKDYNLERAFFIQNEITKIIEKSKEI